jgi:hypothetical protein
MKDLMRVLRWVGELLILLMAMIAGAWACGAVWFDAPFGNANKATAGLLAIGFAITLAFVKPFWRKNSRSYFFFRCGACVVVDPFSDQ